MLTEGVGDPFWEEGEGDPFWEEGDPFWEEGEGDPLLRGSGRDGIGGAAAAMECGPNLSGSRVPAICGFIGVRAGLLCMSLVLRD